MFTTKNQKMSPSFFVEILGHPHLPCGAIDQGHAKGLLLLREGPKVARVVMGDFLFCKT